MTRCGSSTAASSIRASGPTRHSPTARRDRYSSCLPSHPSPKIVDHEYAFCRPASCLHADNQYGLPGDTACAARPINWGRGCCRHRPSARRRGCPSRNPRSHSAGLPQRLRLRLGPWPGKCWHRSHGFHGGARPGLPSSCSLGWRRTHSWRIRHGCGDDSHGRRSDCRRSRPLVELGCICPYSWRGDCLCRKPGGNVPAHRFAAAGARTGRHLAGHLTIPLFPPYWADEIHPPAVDNGEECSRLSAVDSHPSDESRILSVIDLEDVCRVVW
jgi:hypothetical protein